MTKKILIFGLPGAGKTTLATALAARIGAVHLNADAVRENINRDLGFSVADRIEQARRMGWLSDRIVEGGTHAIADFVCPTAETRAAFGLGRDASTFAVFVDRIFESRYADTNRLFERPSSAALNYYVGEEGTPEYHAERIARLLRPTFDRQKPTALLLGRYQPFHAGHLALASEAIRRTGQVLIAVRDVPFDEKNPLAFEDVRYRIELAMNRAGHGGLYEVTSLPNITDVLYGRDVGYNIERVDLAPELTAVSATGIRRAAGI